MANRNHDYVQTLGRKKVVRSGSFEAANPVVGSTRRGKGFTAAYTATGVYTVTFDDKFANTASATCSLEQSTRAQTAEVKSCTASTGVLVIETYTVGGTTLANASAGSRIHFHVLFDDALEN